MWFSLRASMGRQKITNMVSPVSKEKNFFCWESVLMILQQICHLDYRRIQVMTRSQIWKQNEATADNYWLNIAEVWSASGAYHSILCQCRFETLKEVHLVISDCYESVTDHWTEVDWTGLSLVPRPGPCSFLSCKRQKAGQGLGTRLDWTHKNVRNKSINHTK